MIRRGAGPPPAPPDHDEQAAQAYLQLRQGPWTTSDQAALETRLADEPAFADAFQRAGRLWQAVDREAASPALMAMREQALARARRAQAGRWKAPLATARRRWQAGVAAALVLGLAVQLSPYGYRPGVYRTQIGEQRVVELADHSRIALDAATRLRVHYSGDARVVELVDGQAQFSVASDPSRPFKVKAGDRTVVALGTVFTVEYIDRQMRVAMLEGRVAVLPAPGSAKASAAGGTIDADSGRPVAASPPASARPIELGVGEELRITRDGRATVAKADLDTATAWRRGKVVFHDLPLGEAALRVNRYSRLQLGIDDPALAALPVSGVFEAGDTRAFVEALESYLPLAADYSEPDRVRLYRRR